MDVGARWSSLTSPPAAESLEQDEEVEHEEGERRARAGSSASPARESPRAPSSWAPGRINNNTKHIFEDIINWWSRNYANADLGERAQLQAHRLAAASDETHPAAAKGARSHGRHSARGARSGQGGG